MTFWKHSRRDMIPACVTLTQLILNFWLAATWSDRSLLEVLLLGPVGVMMFWYNVAVATHNFLHTPWSPNKTMNRIYGALNSINLGLPQTLYRFHHFNHHRYENDRRGTDGLTCDHSSTFAYGVNGRHEHVIAYCSLGLFRRGTAAAILKARQTGKMGVVWFETLTVAAALVAFLSASWKFTIFFYLPVFYFGWCLAHLENYYEHYGASPEIRCANSVSYYGRLYNMLFCNEGYHQEHHLQPQVHWTSRPQVREKLQMCQDAANCIASAFPPLLGFLDSREYKFDENSKLQKS